MTEGTWRAPGSLSMHDVVVLSQSGTVSEGAWTELTLNKEWVVSWTRGLHSWDSNPRHQLEVSVHPLHDDSEAMMPHGCWGCVQAVWRDKQGTSLTVMAYTEYPTDISFYWIIAISAGPIDHYWSPICYLLYHE